MPEIKRSLAIVIGINQYVNGIPALKTAVNDAKKIAHTLETKYQYQVLRLLDENATGAHLKELFAAFEQQTLPLPDGSKTQLQKDDRLLFYFAGHGIALDALSNADGPVGFLVPQDARMDNDSSLLPMKRLHDALLALPCRHLLVILDCCFAGAFRWAGQRDAVRSQKMYRERYERFISGCAQQVITSAADDEKAADSLYRFGQRSEHEGHSPFAELLLKGLSGEADYSRDGAITATELYVYIHGELGKTSAKQTPGFSQLKRHDKGEYIFPIPGFKANKLEQAPKLDEKANPYKGLESFEERDSHKFFGRKALIETLQDFVNNHSLTVVLGASGSGKSSLVKAGLIPQLKKQRQQWRVLETIRPGESPFRALNQALERENLPVFAIPNKPTDDLTLGDASKEGNSSDNTLWYEQGLQNLSSNLVAWRNLYPNSKLLLVIDQSEELVTLSRDEVEREMFLKGWARALNAFPDWLRIVLTLRSDFEPQFRETALEPYWSGARFLVPAMTREELREAIVEPATAKVMYFEPPKLVDDLIDEVVQMPGALPLLSFTLSELYLKYIKSVTEGKRNNRAITQEDYEQLGGVARSLTQRADCEYEELVKLDPAYEQTVRHVMLRMVAVGGSELARRQVDLSELEYPEPNNEQVKLVIERFASARLLVKGRDIEGNLYVEPAHDALVRGWQKLRTWKDRELASLLLQRELTAIANKWTTSRQDKQAVGLLWDNDPRLPLVRQVFESEDNWLNSLESEFAQRSIQRRRNNRRRLIGSVTGVMVGLTGLSIFAFIQTVQSQLKAIDALVASSNAYMALNQGWNALITSMNALELLRQSAWVNTNPQRQAEIHSKLGQAVYWARERNRLDRHQAIIQSVRFSPDGQILASASYDKTVKLWRSDGSLITTLKGHTQRVMSISFSPDGQTIASGSQDGTVRFWTRNGKPLQVIKAHNSSVFSVCFSPDGRTIATGSEDKTAKLWQLSNRQLMATLRGHTGWVYQVRFSPDGNRIVTISGDKTLKLWTREGKPLNALAQPTSASGTQRGKPSNTLAQHSSDVISVDFSPDGRILATASLDRTVKLWNREGQLLEILPHPEKVYSVSFSRDGQTIASGTFDGVVRLWTRDGRLLDSWPGHEGKINSVNFSPDGEILATASNDKVTKLWQVNRSWLSVLVGHQDYVNSVKFSPDGKLVASAGGDQTVKFWNLKGNLLFSLKGGQGIIVGVSFSPDGRTIASAGADKTVKLWSIDKQALRTFQGHQDQVNIANFSPDGQIIASASNDETAKLWSLDGRELKTLRGHNGRVLNVNFSPDGKTIATSSDDQTVKLWSRDGTELRTLRGHAGSVWSVSFSPDGKTIVTANEDGTSKLWSLDGNLIKTLEGHTAAVLEASFSPDGQTIATASSDRTVKLWQRNGTLITTLIGHKSDVNFVSFSPNGKWLASASSDKVVLLWNVSDLSLKGLRVQGCSQIRDYLKTHPNVSPHLCYH